MTAREAVASAIADKLEALNGIALKASVADLLADAALAAARPYIEAECAKVALSCGMFTEIQQLKHSDPRETIAAAIRSMTDD